MESLSNLAIHASKFSTSALGYPHHHDNGCDAKDCGERIHTIPYHQKSSLFNPGNNLDRWEYHKFTGI